MYILNRNKWEEGFLDYAAQPETTLIRPALWACVQPVTSQYFQREVSLSTVLRYWQEIGGRAVLSKVRSRLAESVRNDKYMSIGVGYLIDASGNENVDAGPVGFLAPNHPRCAERVSVYEGLVFSVTPELAAHCRPSGPLLFSEALDQRHPQVAKLSRLAGWSPESGAPPADVVGGLWVSAQELLEAIDWSKARQLPGRTARQTTRQGTAPRRSFGRERPTAVLFGYGNYAKTIILPNVRRYLDVQEIHELDPLQIPKHLNGAQRWSTEPGWSGYSGTVAALIAGYHHTHCDLAVEALQSGVSAVVEKPIVTSREQQERLTNALMAGGRLFACFHRRYSPVNTWLQRDLNLAREQPLSYHCIVFEEPLPERHWYRWPRSRGRIVSNGCHWIDHFLFLNDYSPVEDSAAHVARDGTVTCNLSLENGAVFSMALTDQGCNRTGMQNYVEIRASGVTARIVNDLRFEGETRAHSVRRSLKTRLRSYQLMYRDIARRIAEGEPGDTLVSVRRSTEAMLQLEEQAEANPSYLSHGRRPSS